MKGSGFLTRSLIELNDHGSMGVTLPKDLLELHDCESGDTIVIADVDIEDGTITLSLPGDAR